jgi:hypothetical protein
MFLCIPALAIIKIIFERVESSSLGKLLGEEDKPTKKKKSKNLRNHYSRRERLTQLFYKTL